MSKMPDTLENPVLMGVIGAPHGVRGQLRVKSYTGDPLALGDYGPLTTADGGTFDVADIRPQKTVVVVTFDQVRSREAAVALNGVELFVDRSQLPDELLEEDEFFVEDLIGMEARDEQGTAIGKVIAVENFGANDLLEIAWLLPSGDVGAKTEYLPFTQAVVPDVDMEAGALTLIKPTEITVAPEGSKEREADPDFEPDDNP